MSEEPKKADSSNLQCTGCGAPVNLRLPGLSKIVICDYCGSVLDTEYEELKIVSTFERNANIKPLFELGDRALFEGQDFEFVGFARKRDNGDHHWDEYLLFNPYMGFRYLAYWSGHWSYTRILKGFPFSIQGQPIVGSEKPISAMKNGKSYKYFFEYRAEVVYVLGEFNWKLKKGDISAFTDYINPPYSLTAEFSGNEVVWSRSEYITPQEIAKAFEYKETLPKPVGVAPNQINPFKKSSTFGLVTALVTTIALTIGSGMIRSEEKVIFNQRYTENLAKVAYDQNRQKTINFDIGEVNIDSKKNLEIKLRANVSNSWAHMIMFFQNEKNQKITILDQGVEYYYGYTDGESWSEGSQSTDFITKEFEPGKYYVRGIALTNIRDPFQLDVKIIRDVIPMGWFAFFLFLIWVPLGYFFWHFSSFEKRRNS